MPRQIAKSGRTPPKERGLYTPEPVRGRVIARHMNGQSNRKIAIEEEIDRETVGRILSQPEITQMIAQYQSRLLSMVPKAISVYDEALSSPDLRIAAAAATKLLEGFRVLPKGNIEQAPAEPDRDQQKRLVLGEIMETILAKHERYGTPLPNEIAGLGRELRKKIEPAN